MKLSESCHRCETLELEHTRWYMSVCCGDNPWGVRDIDVIEKEADSLGCDWYENFKRQRDENLLTSNNK